MRLRWCGHRGAAKSSTRSVRFLAAICATRFLICATHEVRPSSLFSASHTRHHPTPCTASGCARRSGATPPFWRWLFVAVGDGLASRSRPPLAIRRPNATIRQDRAFASSGHDTGGLAALPPAPTPSSTPTSAATPPSRLHAGHNRSAQLDGLRPFSTKDQPSGSAPGERRPKRPATAGARGAQAGSHVRDPR